MKWFLIIPGVLIITGCASPIDFYSLPTFNKNSLQAVIEIPAGTNLKIEYNPKTKRFAADQRNGEDRIISFLGYPGNYGFIPSTYSDPQLGGDGDALDILVIGESVATGTILEVIPIGMLKLIDQNESDYKIIAIPTTTSERTINVLSLQELSKKYKAAQEILQKWFTNYDRDDIIEIEGWGNEIEALAEINKWIVRPSNSN